MKTALTVIGLALLALLSLPLMTGARGETAGGVTTVGFALGDLVRALGFPALAVLALALCATAAGSPPGSLRRALRGLLRLASEEESAAAARALARLARAVEATGLAVALLAAVCAFALVSVVMRDPRSMPPPASFADFVTWSILPAAVGLSTARLLLAPTADALAARAGERARSFSPRGDLGLFAMTAPVLITLVTLFLELPPR